MIVNGRFERRTLTMTQSYNLDDLRSLELKINEKAYNLFKEKIGDAPLQVTRVFKSKRKQGEKEGNCFERDLDVCGLSRVKALIRVWPGPAAVIFVFQESFEETIGNI